MNTRSRKFPGVAAATAVVLPFAWSNAAADYNLGMHISRVLDCSQATAVAQEECKRPGPNRYQVDYALTLTDLTPQPPPADAPPADAPPADAPPADAPPADAPPADAPTPTLNPVTITLDNLNAAFPSSRWELIEVKTTGTLLNVPLNVPGAGFDGGAANIVAKADDFPARATTDLVVRLEVTVEPSSPAIWPTLTASANASASKSVPLFLPVKRDTVLPDPVTGCRDGTPGSRDYIANGSFTRLPANGATALPGNLIANSFASDVPLTGTGFNTYDFNNTLSLVRGSTASFYAQQQSLPGGSSPNWLRYHGIGDEKTIQKFWKQTVSGLVVGREYVLTAYFSNISIPGRTPSCLIVSDPKVRFVAGGEALGNSPEQLFSETAGSFKEDGDVWNQIRATFRATSPQMEIAIQNEQLGPCYNQLGVTQIEMFSCLKPGQDESSPADPIPAPTGNNGLPTTNGVTSASGGGGGGAIGLAWLGLLMLPATIRYRISRGPNGSVPARNRGA